MSITFKQYMKEEDAQVAKLARRKVVVARQVRADRKESKVQTTARIDQMETGMRLHSKHAGRK